LIPLSSKIILNVVVVRAIRFVAVSPIRLRDDESLGSTKRFVAPETYVM